MPPPAANTAANGAGTAASTAKANADGGDPESVTTPVHRGKVLAPAVAELRTVAALPRDGAAASIASAAALPAAVPPGDANVASAAATAAAISGAGAAGPIQGKAGGTAGKSVATATTATTTTMAKASATPSTRDSTPRSAATNLTTGGAESRAAAPASAASAPSAAKPAAAQARADQPADATAPADSSPQTAVVLSDLISKLDAPSSSPDSDPKSSVDAAAANRPAADSGQSATAPVLTDATTAPAAGLILPTVMADAAGRDTKIEKADGQAPRQAGADGVSMAGSLQTNGPAASGGPTADSPVFKLHQGLESPEFSQALADRISWLVDKDVGGAKLQINPPQLGPIEVRVEVQGDKAQVWLSAHSVVTRDVLEASSSKLRDMLGSQGFAQVSVDISQRSFQERPAPTPRLDWTPAAVNSAPDTMIPASDLRTRLAKPGALDAYA